MNILQILNPLEEMAYPAEFNMETLKSIRSYAKRLEYVASLLPRISSGSSRVVYRIDDEKVLKVAKNKKGLAQNQAEADYSIQQYYSIVAKVFDSDENDIFLEMELASKVKASAFRNIRGFSIEDLETYLRHIDSLNNPRRYMGRYSLPDRLQPMHEDEWVQELLDLSGNYSYPIPGDFGRLSTYGLVKRGNEDEVVLIDYGLTHDVMDTHYRR